MFLHGRPPPPPAFPGLTGGVIDDAPGAGLLTPHDELEFSGEMRRLDDIVGRRFAVVGEEGLIAGLDAEAQAAGERLDVQFVPLSKGRERDGRISAWLAGQGARAMILRPDFYAYGLARDAAQAGRQLQELAAKLGA
jgi:hypothetical protein